MKFNRWVRTLGLVTATVVLLASCGSAGAGDDSSAPDFADISLFPMSSDAGSSMAAQQSEAIDHYFAHGSAGWSLQPLLWALVSWNENAPSQYEYDDGEIVYTIQWSRSGNTWCWEVFDAEDLGQASVWFRVCVTDTGSGWEVEVVQDDSEPVSDPETVFAGIVAYDGSSGNIDYFPSNWEVYNLEWSAGPAGWAYQATSRYTGDGVYASRVEFLVSGDGGSGQWSYFTPGTATTPVQSGSWTAD